MMALAREGTCPGLDASGLRAAPACVAARNKPWGDSIVAAAIQPRPPPACCRSARRESRRPPAGGETGSILIGEFIQAKQDLAKVRQRREGGIGFVLCRVAGGLGAEKGLGLGHLLAAGGPAQSELVGSLHQQSRGAVVAGLQAQPAGESFR